MNDVEKGATSSFAQFSELVVVGRRVILFFLGGLPVTNLAPHDEGGPQTTEIFGKMSMLIRIVVMYLCIHLEIIFIYFCASSGRKGFI